jgi:tRNA threonylcarbamoyladenosine biosynthesis protein TsaB
MRLLAIDTALGACSAAVFNNEWVGVLAHETLAMTRGHAEALMPLIARVLLRAKVTVGDLDRIVVTTGPGSFTGLRVGIAAARGLALASGKPAVGITTLSAFAAPHVAANRTLPVVAAIDARHDQVYLQVVGSAGRTLVPPRLTPLREALRVAAAGSARVTGTAANMIAAAWPPGVAPPSVVDQRTAPDIEWIAKLGSISALTGEPPKPFYLRAPDAHPQDAAQLARR